MDHSKTRASKSIENQHLLKYIASEIEPENVQNLAEPEPKGIDEIEYDEIEIQQ